jgi:hypothetical protein
MGSLWGSGWRGRRRRQSKVNRTTISLARPLSENFTEVMIHTGPMIVACQWNCLRVTLEHDVRFHNGLG